LINCGPINQIVRIDELPEKAGPIDQLRQLINGAQHRLDYDDYHQLILFSAAYQITTLLPVIST